MKNTEEYNENEARTKVSDALRTLIVAFNKKQITKHEIADILVGWAKNGMIGYTQGSTVNNLMGWDFVAGFTHELKYVAAEFIAKYEAEKDWVDINGLLNFLNNRGFRIENVKTIERANNVFYEKGSLIRGENYRNINGKEKEYHKVRYFELYQDYINQQEQKTKKRN